MSEDAYNLVKQYRPLIKRLTMNPADADDLEQEVCVRLLNTSAVRPGWWEKVDNKPAYVVRIIKNKFFDLKKRGNVQCGNFDDDVSNASIDRLSDGGSWVKFLNQEMDFEKVRLVLKEAIESFSSYEQTLIQLNFIDGMKPKEISILLNKSYAEVNIDCNRVKATLRGKIKKKIQSLK